MNEKYSASQIIQRVFGTVHHEGVQHAANLENHWKAVVCSIQGNGLNMFDHSRIIDLKNHVLLVETDHPGWTQLFQFHRKFIVHQLSRLVPELEIRTLSFRLISAKNEGGQGLRDITREEAERAADRRCPETGESGNTSTEPSREPAPEIPEELRALFRDLEKSLLTKKRKS